MLQYTFLLPLKLGICKRRLYLGPVLYSTVISLKMLDGNQSCPDLAPVLASLEASCIAYAAATADQGPCLITQAESWCVLYQLNNADVHAARANQIIFSHQTQGQELVMRVSSNSAMYQRAPALKPS